MPHVYTRVKNHVNEIDDAELQCTICEKWELVSAFGSKKDRRPNRSDRYYPACRSCVYVRNHLRSYQGGEKCATASEVREAVGKENTFAVALNQARHGGNDAPSKPLSTATREELRERREETEGKPDMCYLVGMQGDRSAVKIGHSTNVYRRMNQYQAGNPRKLVVLGLLDGGRAKEQELHSRFMHYHSDEFVGEWFVLNPEILNFFGVRKLP